MPIPVMTTRRSFNVDLLEEAESQEAIEALVGTGAAHPAPRHRTSVGAGGARRYEVNGLLHSSYLLGVLIRNFGLKLLFERHDQLDRIQRIRTQVVYK
jgi:hypothetical protein